MPQKGQTKREIKRKYSIQTCSAVSIIKTKKHLDKVSDIKMHFFSAKFGFRHSKALCFAKSGLT